MIVYVALVLAAIPAALYFRNVRLFRPPPPPHDDSRPAISVLIPARNEETSIRACVESVLDNCGVDLECIVLDDLSADRTAAIVEELAIKNPRLRLERAPPLPEGWSGKQHACLALSKLAMKPLLTFLDADVRLAPNALMRMAAFQKSSGAALVSGFPRQETGTLLEKLLIPLMHFILLGFLPIARMRSRPDPSLGAGCGQWFLTTREAYDTVGGHVVVKASFHDGVTLPRAYRRKGFMTDICDATDFATCRMHRSARQVWNGLAKNARESLGSPYLIWFWTLVLAGGQILPFVLLARARTFQELWVSAVICGMSIAPRLDAARRFQQSWLSVLLHPIGIALLIAIQWYATFRIWLGIPVGWKGRPKPTHRPTWAIRHPDHPEPPGLPSP